MLCSYFTTVIYVLIYVFYINNFVFVKDFSDDIDLADNIEDHRRLAIKTTD